MYLISCLVYLAQTIKKYNLFVRFSILKEGVMRDQAYHEHEWKIQQHQRENQRRIEGYHTIQSVMHLRGGIGTVPVLSDTRLQFVCNIERVCD